MKRKDLQDDGRALLAIMEASLLGCLAWIVLAWLLGWLDAGFWR